MNRPLSFFSVYGALAVAVTSSIQAQERSDFYIREEIPLPPGEVMELGSIALMPDQKIAVTSRRGDLWICTGAYGSDLKQVSWTKFAEGLHEPLGMFWKDGWLYLTQRPEVTRIKDSDGDGKADTFETINSDWGIKGDYHEYIFGSDPDKNGDIWTVLCLTGSFTAESPYRGWALRITPKGEMIPTCDSFSGRDRIQCGGRCFLHGQPRAMERILIAEVAQAGLVSGESAGQQVLRRHEGYRAAAGGAE